MNILNLIRNTQLNTMEQFQDVNTIKTRNELTDIWNYWVARKNLIKSKVNSEQESKEISDYLEELIERDKELIKQNRSNAAKARAAKKEAERLAKEAEEREYQESLIQIAEDVRIHNENKARVSSEIDDVYVQIKICEIKMQKYADEIGLTALKEQLNNLQKELKKPIKTCCKHRNKYQRQGSISHGFGDFTRFWKCSDCGHTWDD